jgi:hypothetical protein
LIHPQCLYSFVWISSVVIPISTFLISRTRSDSPIILQLGSYNRYCLRLVLSPPNVSSTCTSFSTLEIFLKLYAYNYPWCFLLFIYVIPLRAHLSIQIHTLVIHILLLLFAVFRLLTLFRKMFYHSKHNNMLLISTVYARPDSIIIISSVASFTSSLHHCH